MHYAGLVLTDVVSVYVRFYTKVLCSLKFNTGVYTQRSVLTLVLHRRFMVTLLFALIRC